MRARARRTLAALALLGASAASLVPARLDAQPPAAPPSSPAPAPTPAATPLAAPAASDSLLEVLVDIRLGQIAARTVVALQRGEEALVPLSELFALAEIRHERPAGGRFRAWLEPGSVQLTADTATGVLRIGAVERRVAPTDLLGRGDEIYLAVGVLNAALDLDFVVSWSDLAVAILDPSPLPIARRLAREQTRRLTPGAARGPFLAPRGIAVDRPRFDGVVADYSLTTANVNPLDGAAWALGLGANVGGGALELTTNGNTNGVHGTTRLAWTGVWPERRDLTVARVGDVFGTGLNPRGVRGVAVTNAPYLRTTDFDSLRFDVVAPPGWDVEFRQGGVTLGWARADSAGRVSRWLPVQYGDNVIETIHYGPFGEVVRGSAVQRVIPNTLRPGTFEYGVTAGQCPTILCEGIANVDLRYGLPRRWTVRAGYDGFTRRGLDPLHHPYVGVAGVPLPVVTVDARHVHRGYSSLAVGVRPSMSLEVQGSATRYDDQVRAPVLAFGGLRTMLHAMAAWRPAAGGRLTALEFDARRTTLALGAQGDVRLSAVLTAQRATAMPFVRYEDFGPAATRRLLAGSRLFLRPSIPGVRWLNGLTAYGDADVDAATGEPASASATLSYQLRDAFRVDVGGSWRRGGGAFTPTLLLSANLAALRARSSAAFTRAGVGTALHAVEGSVLWNRRHRDVAFVPGPSLQRTGFAGRVFLDTNGNGRFDDGEEPVPRAWVRATAFGAETDSLGRYRIWNLSAWDAVPLEVDSASLPSPLWVPTRGLEWLRPGPNRFVPVDIPITPGATLDGRVARRMNGGPGVPGVPVRLEELGAGHVTMVTTFSDGAFFTMRLLPGRYRATVDSATLATLGAFADTAEFTVAPKADGDAIEGVELVMRFASDTMLRGAASPTQTRVATASADGDRDGVPDARDRCAATPPGARVDADGCPALFGATRTLTLPGVNFRTGTAILTPESRTTLHQVAEALREQPHLRVEVAGHTDSTGGRALNMRLSAARAAAVRDFFVREGGVDSTRLTARGYGPDQPTASNRTPEGRAENRRVELRRLDDAPAPADSAGGRAGTPAPSTMPSPVLPSPVPALRPPAPPASTPGAARVAPSRRGGRTTPRVPASGAPSRGAGARPRAGTRSTP